MSFEFKTQVELFDWYDGDTFHGIINQGFGSFFGDHRKPPRIRCGIIDAPEMNTPGGPLAVAYARQIAPPGVYPCWGYGLDTYGRPLIDLVLPGGQYSYLMLTSGYAKPYGK